MCSRNRVDDRQPQADAAVSPSSGRVRPAEPFPDVRQCLLGDTAPVVLDVDDDLVLLYAGAELDRVSVLGVFHCVLEQGVQCAAQALRVDGNGPLGELPEAPRAWCHLRPPHEDILEKRLEVDVLEHHEIRLARFGE